jgi:hypothetical protein
LREVEAPTFSDIWLIDGGKVVSPRRRPLFTPRKFHAECAPTPRSSFLSSVNLISTSQASAQHSTSAHALRMLSMTLMLSCSVKVGNPEHGHTG